jgi:hypothetical protein
MLSACHIKKVKEKCVAKCQQVSQHRNARKTSKFYVTHKNKYKKKVLHEYRSCVILFPNYGLQQIRQNGRSIYLVSKKSICTSPPSVTFAVLMAKIFGYFHQNYCEPYAIVSHPSAVLNYLL